MACSTKSTFYYCITLALVFMVTNSPKASSMRLLIQADAMGINVNGTATCSAKVFANNPTTAPPLANVTVTATLMGEPIGSTITNPNGSFQMTITNLTTIETNINSDVIEGLNVMVPLPISDCPMWANAAPGLLQSNVTVPNLADVDFNVASTVAGSVTV